MINNITIFRIWKYNSTTQLTLILLNYKCKNSMYFEQSKVAGVLISLQKYLDHF